MRELKKPSVLEILIGLLENKNLIEGCESSQDVPTDLYKYPSERSRIMFSS